MNNDIILAAIGSKYNADILRVSDQPQSAQELSKRLNIPTATCYRRINQLREANLLTLHGRVLSDRHRHINVYQRNVDGIMIHFLKEDMEVDLSHRSAVMSQLNQVRGNNSRKKR